jgi:hypothetical protein
MAKEADEADRKLWQDAPGRPFWVMVTAVAIMIVASVLLR